MAALPVQSSLSGLWALVEKQHGVISHRQLLDFGFTESAIKHRLAKGRLHHVWRGVYAVGRPELMRHGWWMAAVLRCGPGAALSHLDAAALFGIRRPHSGQISISVPPRSRPRAPGIRVHRRKLTEEDITSHEGIPVTSPICTIVDIARGLTPRELEAAINEADNRGHADPEEIRMALDHMPRRPGVAIVRELLDYNTFTLTDSELERLFLPLARRAGLPKPLTQQRVNGFRVDFYWPDLGLVVEADSLTYHRTAARQATDRLRDQKHTAAGLTSLRFTHAQVKFRPEHVVRILTEVAARLSGRLSVAGSARSE